MVIEKPWKSVIIVIEQSRGTVTSVQLCDLERVVNSMPLGKGVDRAMDLPLLSTGVKMSVC